MSDAEIIGYLTETTSMVHVNDPGAYEAFRDGKTIFDISSDGQLLGAFISENKPEFGAATILRESQDWPPIPVPVHMAYHKHAAQEKNTPDLQKIEDDGA